MTIRITFRAIFRLARQMFPETHFSNNLIPVCFLHITDQHAQPRRCTQKNKKSELLIVVQKAWWQALSKYSLIKHYHFHYKFHEQNLARRNFPSDHPKCTHVSGKGVTLPKRMVGSAKRTKWRNWHYIKKKHQRTHTVTLAHWVTRTLIELN